MPKEITHLVLAQEIARTFVSSKRPEKKAIGAEIYWVTENYPHEYAFGAVSPDIFFYDVKLPWETKRKPRGQIWGDRIHGTDGEDTMSVTENMLRILVSPNLQKDLTARTVLSREEREKLFAFAIGYATHVALDMTLHPIVYHYAGNYYDPDASAKTRAETRHRAMETILDLWSLRQINESISHFKAVYRITTDKSTKEMLAKFYAKALFISFGAQNMATEKITETQLLQIVRRATRKLLFLNKIFANRFLAEWYQKKNKKKMDKNAEFSSLLYPADTYDDFIRQNEKGFRIDMLKEYVDPVKNTPHKIHRGFLIRKAIARGQRFLKTMYFVYSEKLAPEKARSVLKGYSLNNGKERVPTREMKNFRPLPITGNFIITGDI